MVLYIPLHGTNHLQFNSYSSSKKILHIRLYIQFKCFLLSPVSFGGRVFFYLQLVKRLLLKEAWTWIIKEYTSILAFSSRIAKFPWDSSAGNVWGDGWGRFCWGEMAVPKKQVSFFLAGWRTVVVVVDGSKDTTCSLGCSLGSLNAV